MALCSALSIGSIPARNKEDNIMTKGNNDWGERRTLLAAVMLVLVVVLIAILTAPMISDVELRKVLYNGAVNLFFIGLLGGLLKILLDDVAAAKRNREDAATFVSNVLSDLKSVYDRVARAKILIPAYKSLETYAEEMRETIEAQVQLRNVTRALEKRAAGIDEEARIRIFSYVRKMETYLAILTTEFRDYYKKLSDKQQGYEVPTEMIGTDSLNFPWNLKDLSDFVEEAKAYKEDFEEPLDEASELLRNELARILGSKSNKRSHIEKQSNKSMKRTIKRPW